MWGMVGQWFGQSMAMSWEAGAMIDAHPRFSLSVSGRRDAFDPVLLDGSRTSLVVGVSVVVAGATRPSPPVPVAYEGGRATIRLPVTEAMGRPSIAGDFNGWQPEPMQRVGGDWSYTVTVAPGVYHYAFVDEHGEWFVPENVPGRKEDGMGGYVAVLVVR